jgi:putative oxidoreductase
MARNRFLSLASLALRLVVAGVFGAASVLKLRGPATFAEQIGNYQLFPELSNIIALTLPSIELTAALTLIFARKHWRNAAAMVVFGLLVVFTTAIARAWSLGINLECGCFGTGSTNIGPWPILRNLSLIVALLLAGFFDRGSERLGLGSSRA